MAPAAVTELLCALNLITDGANAGLDIMMNILKPVKDKFPHLSNADIWTRAGAMAVEFTGGPKVPFNYGRTDGDASGCPENGRLPDAAQGAEHLRDVFYRMGFNDQEIVALSGAHTLGRCHKTRSGFDGPWTSNPLKFDNEYFKNLLEKNWTKRVWDGPDQFQDESGELMMLPTDIALTTDASFMPWVQKYASDQGAFFKDFATAFGKLMSKVRVPIFLSQFDIARSSNHKFTAFVVLLLGLPGTLSAWCCTQEVWIRHPRQRWLQRACNARLAGTHEGLHCGRP